jgi:hypothetical protein
MKARPILSGAGALLPRSGILRPQSLRKSEFHNHGGIEGWNLGPVAHAISYGSCERIREYHAKLYDPPAPGEPVIEKIAITMADEKLK